MVSKLTVRTNVGNIIDVDVFKVMIKPCEGHIGGVGYEVFSYLISEDGEDNYKSGTLDEQEFRDFIGQVKGMGEVIQEVIRE
jgi:hypothetical protein